jgi:hypothetical protein
MQNLNTLLTAAAGTAAVEVADKVTMPAPEDVQSIGQLIIQVIIGIVTIWKMVKKPKPKKETGSDAI